MKWIVLSVMAASSLFAAGEPASQEVSMSKAPRESAALPQKCVEEPKEEECAPPPKCCPPKKKKCPPPKCENCPPKVKKCKKPSRCDECTENPNQPKCKSAARKVVEGS